MDRLKNIIVVADFSEASDIAVREAMRMSQWNDAALHVLHVIDEVEAAEAAELVGMATPQQVRERLCKQVKRRLEMFVPVATGGEPIEPEFDLSFDVMVGDPFFDVLGAVNDLSADLLVVGHDRLDGPDVVGHLAQRFARKASTKVMLVRPDEPTPFRRVVACVDFSEMSQRVIQQGIRVARQEGAELHIAHLPVPSKRLLDLLDLTGEVAQSRRAEHLDRMRARMERLLKPFDSELAQVDVHTHMPETNDVIRGLTGLMHSDDRTLAVIGSRGRKNFKGMLMGTTAETLVDAAPCSLLIVKPAGFHYEVAR